MGRDFWENSFKTENKREIKQTGFHQNKKILPSKGTFNRVQRTYRMERKSLQAYILERVDIEYILLKKI